MPDCPLPYKPVDGCVVQSREILHPWLRRRRYAIIDTSEEAVVLFVNHEATTGQRQTGNVYISDKEATRFTLALENVATAAGGVAESRGAHCNPRGSQ